MATRDVVGHSAVFVSEQLNIEKLCGAYLVQLGCGHTGNTHVRIRVHPLGLSFQSKQIDILLGVGWVWRSGRWEKLRGSNECWGLVPGAI